MLSNDSLCSLELMKSGSFGRIYRAWSDLTKCHVAVKKVSVCPSQSRNGARKGPQPENEVEIQSSLSHANIVRLLQFWTEDYKIIMVMEWMSYTLKEILPQLTTDRLKKQCKVMALRAVEFIHQNAIMHRDIKPDNFLVNSNGVVKLGDFGLARKISISDPRAAEQYSSCAGTRAYRAPELLFGCTKYNQQVDLWSTGCLCAEIYTNRILLSADTDIGQLGLIINVFGDPLQNGWKRVTVLPDYGKLIFLAPTNPAGLRKLLPRSSESFLDFLKLFLVYDPEKRQTASSALTHTFLKDITEEVNIFEAVKNKENSDKKQFGPAILSKNGKISH